MHLLLEKYPVGCLNLLFIPWPEIRTDRPLRVLRGYPSHVQYPLPHSCPQHTIAL